MGKLKTLITSVVITCTTVLIQHLDASVPSPSIELLFSSRGGPNQTTTPSSSISQRIQTSLNNVLRIPLPLFGATPLGQPSQSSGGNGGLLQQSQNLQPSSLLELRQQVTGTHSAPPPHQPLFPHLNQAVQTIAQLSTLTHWPFGYVTTSRPLSQPTTPKVETPPPTTQATPPPPPPPPSTTQVPTTTPEPTTQLPATAPPTPPSTTQYYPPPLPPLILPPQSASIFPYPTTGRPVRPSLVDRLHNRIQSVQSTINIRLPNLSHIGQPRPRPMLTEPPWVTELLGPTLEPPTTRAPTLGERVHNAVNNVLLFVPATLLNFWYQNWGTQHVDRVIQRLQIPTAKPGAAGEPIFAISSQASNPLNFTSEQLAALNSTDLPAIAAFINSNGTLMPTIVQPVLNKDTNTVEYILRGENETTVLWTGSLSNEIFLGNKNPEDVDSEVDIVDVGGGTQEQYGSLSPLTVSLIRQLGQPRPAVTEPTQT